MFRFYKLAKGEAWLCPLAQELLLWLSDMVFLHYFLNWKKYLCCNGTLEFSESRKCLDFLTVETYTWKPMSKYSTKENISSMSKTIKHFPQGKCLVTWQHKEAYAQKLCFSIFISKSQLNVLLHFFSFSLKRGHSIFYM